MFEESRAGKPVSEGDPGLKIAATRRSLPRPTLSVLTAVHQWGGLTAAALEVVRPLADEIVVAFDSRTPRDQLGPLEAVADVLIGFEFSGQKNRFRPWLREQANSEWLLLLDGDEIVSTQLLTLLPELVARKDISGYILPCWWVFPNPTMRLSSPPWDHDRHLRLVRNDGRLWFPGTKHTGARCDPPTRFVDAPFIHLDLIVTSECERHAKVLRNDEEKFPLFAPDGRLINETFYLPERDVNVRTLPIPAADAKRITGVLARKEEFSSLKRQSRIVPAAEVDRWWAACPIQASDYRAEIELVQGESRVLERTSALFELDVTNLGQAIWPASDLRRDGPLIRLSYHWKNLDGSMAVWGGRRTPLSSRILPGERVRMQVVVDTPALPGRYRLAFDLVHESVRWFGLNKEIEIDVEPLFEQLRLVDGRHLVSVESARAARRRLRGLNSLANALRPDDKEDLDPRLDIETDAWQMHRAALNFLLGRIRRENVTRILEFGSGVSTVAFAREIAPREGMVLSVEQDATHAARTSQLLSERGLAKSANVVSVGLAETRLGGARTLCYDFIPNLQREIRALAPQLIVIDGPSQASGASRLAIAPSLLSLLEQEACFAMDDAFRDAELEIADRWRKEPQIEIDGVVVVGRGLLIGRLRSDRP